VKGELYRVSSEQLTELDRLEDYEENGANNLYERIITKVTTEKGEQEAIVYVMTSIKGNFIRIDGNDWILRKK
jgi:gamma-glutamylcyclotransferase (GGCT)/AIG2-like uncharacterized protein YtfP